VNIREARESLKITAYPHEIDPVSHAQGFIEGYESHKKEAEKLVEEIERELGMNEHDVSCSSLGGNNCDCHIPRLKEVLEAYKKERGE
jgi:hypothetical protein